MGRLTYTTLAVLAAAGFCAGPAPWPVCAKETPEPVSAAERDASLGRALRYLEGKTLSLPDSQGTPRKPFDVAAAGYVHLLARRSRSSTEGLGRDFVQRCRRASLDYVSEVERRSRDPEQLPSRHGLATSEALVQYTWPLAMCAIFHAELHAQGVQPAVARRTLARIVTLLGEAQDENGGWGHGRIAPKEAGAQTRDPIAALDRVGAGYPSTLLASSALVAASLGIARTAAGDPEGPDLGKARAYFVTAQLPNGNFPYDPSQRQAHRDRTGAGRTAGSLFALWTLGVPLTDKSVARAAEYLDEHPADVAEGHGSAVLTLLYGALAARVRGGRPWQAFRERFFRPIVAAQSEEGAYSCIAEGKLFGTTNDSRGFGASLGGFFQDGVDVYVTALHAWILLLDVVEPRPPGRAAPESPAGSPVTPR